MRHLYWSGFIFTDQILETGIHFSTGWLNFAWYETKYTRRTDQWAILKHQGLITPETLGIFASHHCSNCDRHIPPVLEFAWNISCCNLYKPHSHGSTGADTTLTLLSLFKYFTVIFHMWIINNKSNFNQKWSNNICSIPFQLFQYNLIQLQIELSYLKNIRKTQDIQLKFLDFQITIIIYTTNCILPSS